MPGFYKYKNIHFMVSSGWELKLTQKLQASFI